jgi:hypothetical protein
MNAVAVEVDRRNSKRAHPIESRRIEVRVVEIAEEQIDGSLACRACSNSFRICSVMRARASISWA